MSVELDARAVLSRYPQAVRGSITSLGSHGGFSGAQLWRIDTSFGSYCLKAWPAGWRSPTDLAWIHELMAQASAFPWMPRVLAATAGPTIVSHQGRLWELVTWMPGTADFSRFPSPARLTAACTALAELHRASAPLHANHGVCPAVLRRLESLRVWRQLLQSGWRPIPKHDDPFSATVGPLFQMVAERIDGVPHRLAPWLDVKVPTQPCVCDLWHDHVLFTGDTVTGLIDFGSVKEDHVAVDLARLLGSMVDENRKLWDVAFAAYSALRPLSADERRLAYDLDATGVILAATHWLRWLYHEKRSYDRPDAVVARLGALLDRLRSPKM